MYHIVPISISYSPIRKKDPAPLLRVPEPTILPVYKLITERLITVSYTEHRLLCYFTGYDYSE